MKYETLQWKVNTGHDPCPYVEVCCMDGAYGDASVIDVSGENDDFYTETFDNPFILANFIAAAPEMYKCLKWIVDNKGAHPENIYGVALQGLQSIEANQ